MSLLGNLVQIAESPFHRKQPIQPLQKVPPLNISGGPISVQPSQYKANIGVPEGAQPQLGTPNQTPQVGDFNPGYIALQNSGNGPGGNTQIDAFNSPQPGFGMPQYRIQPGQEWRY